MEQFSEDIKYESKSEIFHSNEKIIRSGFTSYIPIKPSEIVKSSDADDILGGNRAQKIVNKLKCCIIPKNESALKPYQTIFRPNCYWTHCKSRRSVITEARFFLVKEKPKWRCASHPIILNYGIHLSWIKSIPELILTVNPISDNPEKSILTYPKILWSAIESTAYPSEYYYSSKIGNKDSHTLQFRKSYYRFAYLNLHKSLL